MRRPSHVGVVLAGASALALFALSANAGPPGKWTQITHAHNGARTNLGLARGKDGSLHVLWAGPNRAPFPAIFDTTISRKGAVGKPRAVISGWSGVNTPTAAAASNGSIHAIVSGQRVGGQNDPYDGLNEVVGPGTWKLGPKAFGTRSLTVASNADVHSAFLKNGQLLSVWQSAAALLFQVGVDPATTPTDITPKGLGVNPVLAVDDKTGEAIVGYHGVTNGQNVFRRIQPSLGAGWRCRSRRATACRSRPVPAAASTRPTRRTGSAYGWHTTAAASRRLYLCPRERACFTAGVAAGPEGRLWVFYGNDQQTYVTRTSKAVRGFEPVQTLKSPAKTAQYFRLEGEGSTGPLDLFADVTVDGKTKDGSYRPAGVAEPCRCASRVIPSAGERR